MTQRLIAVQRHIDNLTRKGPRMAETTEKEITQGIHDALDRLTVLYAKRRGMTPGNPGQAPFVWCEGCGRNLTAKIEGKPVAGICAECIALNLERLINTYGHFNATYGKFATSEGPVLKLQTASLYGKLDQIEPDNAKCDSCGWEGTSAAAADWAKTCTGGIAHYRCPGCSGSNIHLT